MINPLTKTKNDILHMPSNGNVLIPFRRYRPTGADMPFSAAKDLV